jgi:pyruvate kinase
MGVGSIRPYSAGRWEPCSPGSTPCQDATALPQDAPIVALTGDPETCRRLALVRGVLPLLLPASSQDPEQMITAARRAARARGWPDMRAVFVSHDRLWTGRL